MHMNYTKRPGKLNGSRYGMMLQLQKMKQFADDLLNYLQKTYQFE